MADVKISALPAAGSALGTDEFPINQGGTTKKVTTTQIGAALSGSFANTTLSNLTSPTSIPQDLIPNGALTQNLGNVTHCWDRAWINSIKPTGSAVSVIETSIRTLVNASAANVLDWSGADVQVNTNFIPNSNNTKNLGSTSNQFRNLYVANSIIAGANTFANMTVGTIVDPIAGLNYISLRDGVIFDSAGNATLEWNSGTISEAGVVKIDFAGGQLNSSSGVPSIDWENRLLYNSTGATQMLDWSLAGSLNAKTNKIINVVDPTNPQDAATRAFVLANAGSGTVTSVALALPVSVFTITGSPVTTSGTLTGSFATQTANTIFSGPASGGAAVPTFRGLVSADIPNNAANTSGTASNVTGIVAVANGGTSLSTLTLNNVILGNGASAPTFVAPGTSGNILTSNGTTWLSSAPAVNAITALTGDVTASGTGSVAATLATVNGNVGSFGSSTSIPSFTVNAKGLITAASGNAVIAPAGTLTGATLAANVLASSLTSVGTITSGTWNGTTIAIANGGTGQVTANAGFNALSPMTTGGDLIYGGASGVGTRLANGTAGQILQSQGGTAAPQWSSALLPAANFFASSQITTASTAINSTTFTTFSNSPALTFTPTTTGKWKIYGSFTLFASTANSVGVCKVFNTTGGATLLQESQGSTYGSTGTSVAGTFAQSTYTLTAGVTYVFDVQGAYSSGGGIAGNIILSGDLAPCYMFAELCASTGANGYAVNSISSNTTAGIGNTYLADTSGGAFNLTLPTPVLNGFIMVKDSTGSFGTNNLTIVRSGSEKIEGVAASKVLQTNWGAFTFLSNGTDWFMV